MEQNVYYNDTWLSFALCIDPILFFMNKKLDDFDANEMITN
jgi:hypothetical protein